MDKEVFKNRGRKLKLILDSATFALLLSIVLFSYEMISSTKETDEIVANLMEIQGSLSTRYLGLFPEYIDNINSLLNHAIEEQNKVDSRDSIIIFEDVLYYGIRSDAAGFRNMLENIVTLTNHGCHITIAYYDVDGIPFKHMIRDGLIPSEYQKEYRDDMTSYRNIISHKRGRGDDNVAQSHNALNSKIQKLLHKHANNCKQRALPLDAVQLTNNAYSYKIVDSLLNEHYYAEARKANPKKYAANISALLKPLPQKIDAVDATSLRVNQLCEKLDDIKQHYLDKPSSKISYFDFHNMYRDVTLAIVKLLKQQPNIELISLNESLMMSCWMSSVNHKEQVIFAFPSKYSTDEIGFISQDANIVRYIHTMLKGVKVSHGK